MVFDVKLEVAQFWVVVFVILLLTPHPLALLICNRMNHSQALALQSLQLALLDYPHLKILATKIILQINLSSQQKLISTPDQKLEKAASQKSELDKLTPKILHFKTSYYCLCAHIIMLNQIPRLKHIWEVCYLFSIRSLQFRKLEQFSIFYLERVRILKIYSQINN